MARRLSTRAKGLRIATIAMRREAYCSPYDSDTRRRRRRMGMKFSGTPCQFINDVDLSTYIDSCLRSTRTKVQLPDYHSNIETDVTKSSKPDLGS